jgi:hypothetical protein
MSEKESVPFWVSPLERMTEEAIALWCDGDNRIADQDTMIVRMYK